MFARSNSPLQGAPVLKGPPAHHMTKPMKRRKAEEGFGVEPQATSPATQILISRHPGAHVAQRGSPTIGPRARL